MVSFLIKVDILETRGQKSDKTYRCHYHTTDLYGLQPISILRAEEMPQPVQAVQSDYFGSVQMT